MKQPVKNNDVYLRIRQILESARATAARSVNTVQVMANWLIGREIVEEEQRGKRKAEYGKQLLDELAKLLMWDFGGGYSATNLRWFRQFYLLYPQLLRPKIHHAVRGELPDSLPARSFDISPRESWKPGWLNPNLSWTHYRTLLRVDVQQARAFYEIEAIKNNWSARELERQINSLLFERLAKSRDKKGVMRLNRTTGDWHRGTLTGTSRVVTALNPPARTLCAKSDDTRSSPGGASPDAGRGAPRPL